MPPLSGSSDEPLSAWQRWLQHPEKSWLHRMLFQVHLWLGIVATLYLLMMSMTGSAIVFRNELERSANVDSRLVRTVEWLVDLHENLLLGMTGRSLNGIGAICLTLLVSTGVIIWWPGIAHWRRSLTVNWKSSFARLNWDWHNALGFWCFFFVLIWSVSGIYFCFPGVFDDLLNIFDPTGTSRKAQVAELALLWLSNLHFGRFGWFPEALWAFFGLAPAVLALTGVFMYGHRLLFALPHPSRYWRFPDAAKPVTPPAPPKN
jgi:uncharacterized iron-regulated membrane protein